MSLVEVGDRLVVEGGGAPVGLRRGDGVVVLAVVGSALRVRHAAVFYTIDRTVVVSCPERLLDESFWAKADRGAVVRFRRAQAR